MSIIPTQQINQNECGVCVLHTLIRYYYRKEVQLTELLSAAKLTEQGLSLFDFELLAQQYGLQLESFNATIDDLKTVKPYVPFILILKNEAGLHYVIATKNKRRNYDIYCSQKGQYQLSELQLQQVWAGVYISCQKQFYSFKHGTITKPLSFKDLKGAIIINLINMIYLVLCLFCSSLMQKITSQITTSIYMNTIFAILITYLIAYLCQYLLKLFIDLINQKRNYQAYHWLYTQVIKSMALKYNDFFNKIDFNYLINIDDYLFTISSFYTTKISQIFTNVILILAVVLISSWINVWILAVVILSMIINICISMAGYWYQKNNLIEIQKEINNYQQQHLKCLNMIKTYSFIEQLKLNLSDLKNNHQVIKNRYYKGNRFGNNVNFWDGFSNLLSFIFLILIGVWLIQNEHLNLSQLIFLVSLFQLVSQHIKGLCQIPNAIVELKHAKQVINNVLNIDNLSLECKAFDDIIKTVEINNLNICNDTLISGPNGVGKTHLLKSLCHRIKSNFEIKINDLDKSWLGDCWFINNCVYVNQQTLTEIQTIESLLTNSKHYQLVAKTMSSANIQNLNIEQLSSGQKQVLSFVSLLSLKNKIIVLDEALANVDDKLKPQLLSKIKPILAANNFIISVDHNKHHHQYYKEEIILHEQLH